MSLSLNGIKSTGMHLEVQRPAKWRRGGCDRERTGKPFGEMAGHSNGVEWVARPNPFDPEGMTHENVFHSLGRAVICCGHHRLRFLSGQRNQVASCRVFLDSAFQHTPRGDRGAGGEPRRPKRYRPRNARLRACLSVASGSLFEIARAVAEVGPIDIGSQVFAADSAIGGLLNSRATLRRYRPLLLYPLIHGRRRNADQSGQCRLTTDYFTGCLNGDVFHKAEHKAQHYAVSIGIA